jgi:hypothetical protein
MAKLSAAVKRELLFTQTFFPEGRDAYNRPGRVRMKTPWNSKER